MLSIILAVFLGIIFTFVAIQNPALVPVTLLNYAVSVPLYIVAAIAFLAGIFLTLLVNVFDTTAIAFDMRGKDSKLRQFQVANDNLSKRIYALEAENQRLRENLKATSHDLRDEKIQHTKQSVRNFFGRFKHSFSA